MDERQQSEEGGQVAAASSTSDNELEYEFGWWSRPPCYYYSFLILFLVYTCTYFSSGLQVPEACVSSSMPMLVNTLYPSFFLPFQEEDKK